MESDRPDMVGVNMDDCEVLSDGDDLAADDFFPFLEVLGEWLLSKSLKPDSVEELRSSLLVDPGIRFLLSLGISERR